LQIFNVLEFRRELVDGSSAEGVKAISSGFYYRRSTSLASEAEVLERSHNFKISTFGLFRNLRNCAHEREDGGPYINDKSNNENHRHAQIEA
jgi:hypothetical protein